MAEPSDSVLVYLVACEASADQLGAQLMTALREETRGAIRFAGIGGPRMTAAGLSSLFDPAELALLGIFEVVPAFRRVLARVAETVADIHAKQPAILVTIDSWGFTGRIHQRLARQHSLVPRLRYVAPQVWAWRPRRARQLARWIHHLMALFPFEPPYFVRHGLPTTWVGHPVVESGADRGDAAGFRGRHGIAGDKMVVAVLPGSRRGEISRLLPCFGETVRLLARTRPNLVAVIPAVAAMKEELRRATVGWPVPIIVVDGTEIYDAFAASAAALAASGTVSLELAMAAVPHIIAYRVNPLSAMAFQLLRRTRFVNLVNILLDHGEVPEMLQEDCTPQKLAAQLERLLENTPMRDRQRTAFRAAIAHLSPPGETPSQLAARTVLAVVKIRGHNT